MSSKDFDSYWSGYEDALKDLLELSKQEDIFLEQDVNRLVCALAERYEVNDDDNEEVATGTVDDD